MDTVEKMRKRPSVMMELIFLLGKIVFIALVFLMLFTFMFGIVRCQDLSMAPAVKDGDLVVFYRHTQSGFKPNDTIVVDYDGYKHARRVVATAGDIVDVRDGGLRVNGALQQEPEIYQETERFLYGVDFPLTVPDGGVFVLGDNRRCATDSRIYGPVMIGETKGKVMAVIRRRNI